MSPLLAPEAVFIATLGTEPQVITTALDLLLRRGEKIRQVVVLHTVSPGTAIEAACRTLEQEFARPPYAPDISLLMVSVQDATAQPVSDVESPHEVQAAFQTIYRELRRAKLAGLRVHLSIAGGRKTMSVFGMAAAQLLFDEGDHLWHLYSGGEFLQSKRLHPLLEDNTHLIPIPIVHWAQVSPILLEINQITDPYEVLKRQQEMRLSDRLEAASSFVRGSLTPAEERVVALLVQTGMSDQEIADRLYLSPRTVEQHLRSAYMKAAAHWDLANVGRSQLITLLNLFYLAERSGAIDPKP